MRVSSLQYFQGNVGKLTDVQAQLVELQQQIASGVSVDRPSDDPTRLFQGIQAQRGIDRAAQYNRNIVFARTQLEQIETGLSRASDNLVDVKERMIQAANGTLSAADKKTIAITVQSLRDDLLQTFNQKDLSGRYLFSGKSEDQQTFAVQSPGPTFPVYQGEVAASAGSAGLTVEVGNGIFVNLGLTAREAVVLSDADALTATPEVNVFSLLDDAINLLNNNASAAQLAPVASQLDAVFDKVQNSRTAVGIRLATLDANEAINSSDQSTYAQMKKDAVDTDVADAISKLVQGQSQAQAFQLSYSNIAKLSLFNFIA
ncbi:MAG TPA: flagellar hook-associated protein FlgL [Limnobacter sp.]|uniref:flagellar hook-associated protein FlgL n=1 Tax=Limnobacter sp. TaxID=2003368 RepID=UPI002ED7E1BB